MDFQPGFFGRLFSGAGEWTASVRADGVAIAKGGVVSPVLPLRSVQEVEIREGWIWSTVSIQTELDSLSLVGLSLRDAVQSKVELAKIGTKRRERVFALLRPTSMNPRSGL